MYWAVNSFGACAGIEITASHNPINFNGMKIVKSGAQPLDEKDFQIIKILQRWVPGKRIKIKVLFWILLMMLVLNMLIKFYIFRG